MVFTARIPAKLNQDLVAKYGIDWKKDRQKHGKIVDKLDMACVERICANLRLLLPLRTAMWMEGINSQSQDMFFKRVSKNMEPFKWAMEQFEQAKAEGEGAILKKLQDSSTTEKDRKRLQWLLERAIAEDTYTPRTKTTKTVTENKSVSVTMKVSGNVTNLNRAQAQAQGKVLEATVVKELPAVPAIVEK